MRRARSAMRMASGRLASACADLPFGSGRGRAALPAWARSGPVSETIMPSRISTVRLACAATPGSCVMRITVWPWLARSFSKAITSSPLLESSAPVGSSARMMSPPFISARAIETRCCCPPDKLVRPVGHPVAESELGQKRGGACMPRGWRKARIDRGNLDILRRRRRVDEIVALEDEAEGFAPQPGQRIAVEDCDIAAREDVGASRRPIEAADDVHQRALA